MVKRQALLLDCNYEPPRSSLINVTQETHDDVSVMLPYVHPEREVIVGKRVDPKPTDPPYIGFLAYVNVDDYREAQNNVVGEGATAAQILLHEIFGKVQLEPEVPVQSVAIDGARTLRVKLHEHFPGLVLYIPEELVT